MSLPGTTLAACPDVQAELDNYFATANSSLLREPAPFLDFLMSQENRLGVQQIMAPGGAKTRKMILRYDQRISEADVTDAASAEMSCSASTKRGDLTKEYEIDPAAGWELSERMTVSEWHDACRGNGEIFAKKVQMLVDGVYRKTATKVVGQALALLGRWDNIIPNSDMVDDGGVEYLKISTRKTGSTDPNPLAWEDIDLAITKTGFPSAPVIFAGTNIYKYARLMQAGCCSTAGLDLAAIAGKFGKAVAWDRRIEKLIAADKAWVVAPNVLYPITYTGNDDGIDTAITGAGYIKQVIFDPMSGMPMDLKIVDTCGEGIDVIVRANVKVVGLPDDLFGPDDDWLGVKWFAGIKNVNA